MHTHSGTGKHLHRQIQGPTCRDTQQVKAHTYTNTKGSRTLMLHQASKLTSAGPTAPQRGKGKWREGRSAGVSGLQPHPRAAHTPPYSPRTPPHTPNASLPGVLPTLPRCVCTPKHPRLPVPPDCDPFAASPSTSNTHTPKSPAPTGSPGNTEAPAPAPGPGKSPALQARAPPPPQAPLPLPKVGGHSAVPWEIGRAHV